MIEYESLERFKLRSNLTLRLATKQKTEDFFVIYFFLYVKMFFDSSLDASRFV